MGILSIPISLSHCENQNERQASHKSKRLLLWLLEEFVSLSGIHGHQTHDCSCKYCGMLEAHTVWGWSYSLIGCHLLWAKRLPKLIASDLVSWSWSAYCFVNNYLRFKKSSEWYHLKYNSWLGGVLRYTQVKFMRRSLLMSKCGNKLEKETWWFPIAFSTQ